MTGVSCPLDLLEVCEDVDLLPEDMDLLSELLSRLEAADRRELQQQYSMVRSRSVALKRELSLSSEVGALKENIKKNRYKDILPYDQSRVVLSLLTSDSDSDYINASFIQGASSSSSYIACQGPLSSTVTDFWRMIWQHEVKVIVMACREVEMGKKKCERYWTEAHQSTSFGPFTVTNLEETRPNEDVVIRELTVSYLQMTRSLIQYQFLSWPDHDVPYETSGVLDLLDRARTRQGTHNSPLLVHCSAGCGRTGVICAIDYIHDLLVTKQLTADFSIMDVVLLLRRQRPLAVQTKEQYLFIFTAVISMFKNFLQPSASELYSNISQPKKPKKKNSTTASSSDRRSKQVEMNDTYAVVNKPRQPLPPPSDPAYSVVNKPQSSRMMPASHHYDNEPSGAPAAPIYSTVKPRANPHSFPRSTTPIYDIAAPSSQRPSEGRDYQLVSAEHHSPSDNDYEDVSSSVSDVTSFCSPGSIEFNCRVQKPRGPRDPPAEWSRLER
ncbi:tyrosine-protein phosphatase non-receptor type 18 isoform X2 [Acanthochromis polyacanthus]|uniref:tyrosine-protein phosphatase non-receptor type 18 isoform X2 n=1 Tax=Acanthochromis polyacanthus TaxID=80966 RepID=UPI0022340EC5|nr:tyrosine-protein phosphatase non-receptor type 18 isoform X2 [Acanthochromis polyacanthus]